MIARALKLLALVVGGLILIPLIGVGYFIVSERIAYEKADITTALLRDGRYDPAEHFTFERACTYATESGGLPQLNNRGYRNVDLIYLPDTFTHWSLVLIDDSKKTYRILYAVDPLVKFGGAVCNPKITLRTETIDGQLRAYVEQERIH